MEKWEIANLKGVIPALITPFNEDESLSEEKLRNMVEHLIEVGVDGFYLTGSTGEGFVMNVEERKKVLEIVIDQTKDRVPVISHVGTIDTKSAVELAKHAYETGASALSSVPPFYYKFTFDEIYNYYKDISEATPLPMIVYSIAATTGVDLGVAGTKKLAEIGNVKGIKFTSKDHYEMQRIKEQLGKDFMVYSGSDEMCVSGLMMGADGIIGSFYNMDPEVYLQIEEAVKDKDFDLANEKLIIANDIVEIFLKHNYYPSMRAALKWMGIDCGRNRRPFHQLTEAEVEALRKDLIELKERKNIKGIRVLDTL